MFLSRLYKTVRISRVCFDVLMFWSKWRLKFDRQIKSPSFIIEHAVINFLSAPSAAVKYRFIILQLKGVLYTQNALLCWWLVVRRNGGVRRRLSAGVSLLFSSLTKVFGWVSATGDESSYTKKCWAGVCPILDVCLLCPHIGQLFPAQLIFVPR